MNPFMNAKIPVTMDLTRTILGVLFIGTLIADKVGVSAASCRSLGAFPTPSPPCWLDRIPIAGPKVAATWRQYAALPREELSALLTPYAGKALRWFAAQARSLLTMFLQFLLTVIISALLYAKS